MEAEATTAAAVEASVVAETTAAGIMVVEATTAAANIRAALQAVGVQQVVVAADMHQTKVAMQAEAVSNWHESLSHIRLIVEKGGYQQQQPNSGGYPNQQQQGGGW